MMTLSRNNLGRFVSVNFIKLSHSVVPHKMQFTSGYLILLPATKSVISSLHRSLQEYHI